MRALRRSNRELVERTGFSLGQVLVIGGFAVGIVAWVVVRLKDVI